MGVEALCSSTFFGSNIAASAPTLPFSVAIDLLFRDAGISRRVKRLSRTRRRILSWESKSVFSVASSSGNSCFGRSNGRRLESSICRASSPESEDSELLGRENQIMDAGKKGITLEKVLAEDGRIPSSGVVGLNFGSSNGVAEGFQRSPLPDFEDEFFSRMMALEASPLSTSRASSTSTAAFFKTLNAGCNPPRPSPGQGVESPGDSKVTSTSRREQELNSVLGMGGVQLPPSIKKLRRRKNEVKGDSAFVRSARESGCAIKRAFSSMVYMIKAVQSHALQIRQVLFSDKWDVQQVLHLVDREMHSSFVWLFQRVFACTPTLMVSVMILLANFTVFSMGEKVAIATVTETPTAIATVTETPTAIAHILSTYCNPQASSPDSTTLFTNFPAGLSRDSTTSPLPAAGYGAGGRGNNNFPSAPIAEGFDGDSWLNGFEPHRRYGFSEKDSSMTRDFPSTRQFGVDMTKERPSHQEMMKAWVESSMKNQVQLDQETTQRLVAPVVAHLESDKYACFDRTDLEYQHALAKDPGSAVLLANYAQFLFVVRRDNNRAEQYFHRAMEADPSDSTILGRFASFLWLGRGNRSSAERAYKAAMAAEPESSNPAGSYAHFLWHAGDDDTHGRVA